MSTDRGFRLSLIVVLCFLVGLQFSTWLGVSQTRDFINEIRLGLRSK